MNTEPIIRPEHPDDHATIFAVTEAAFRGRPYAAGDEQELVDRLRELQVLTVSLVAELQGKVVGHIAFSPADQADDSAPWFALGPVSVAPDLQLQGIGSLLINAGLSEIRKRGALGCILTGNPLYYQRFGFDFAPNCVPDRESAEFFMLTVFGQHAPTGKFAFHSAFYE